MIRENAFEHKKKKPRLSANRSSNNWAQGFEIRKSAHRISNPDSDWNSDPSLTDKESRIQYVESRIQNMEF